MTSAEIADDTNNNTATDSGGISATCATEGDGNSDEGGETDHGRRTRKGGPRFHAERASGITVEFAAAVVVEARQPTDRRFVFSRSGLVPLAPSLLPSSWPLE